MTVGIVGTQSSDMSVTVVSVFAVAVIGGGWLKLAIRSARAICSGWGPW